MATADVKHGDNVVHVDQGKDLQQNEVRGVQKFKDSKTGKVIPVYGTWQQDSAGRTVSGRFQAGQDGNYYDIRRSAHGTWQMSQIQASLTSDGKLVREVANSTSETQLQDEGFVQKTTSGPGATGTSLYTTFTKGQQATDVDKVTVDRNDTVKFSNMHAVRAGYFGQDPAKFINAHPDIIAAYGAVGNAVNNVQRAKTLVKGAGGKTPKVNIIPNIR